MTTSDDSMRATWERRLASIQENIDQYILLHYQPCYVEHGLGLDNECDEDVLVTLPSFGAIPGQDSLAEERCFSVKDAAFKENAFSLDDNLEIDDLLQQQEETFSQMLLRMIDERNLKDSTVYKDANIDRRLFSKIRGDEDYIPSKKTVICFCMALQLDLPEARKLLESAGYALSASSRFDLIIMYLLENKEFNVVFANIVLKQYGESALTR